MLIGNKLAASQLKQLVCRGQVHSIVLTGPEGVGKKSLAMMAVEWSAGQEIKKIAPDLLVISPEAESKKLIGKPKADLILRHLSRSAIIAHKKFVIIEQAHLLSKEAGNSLLISLEEPKGASLIILTTINPAGLLPTILSRSVIIKLGPVAPQIIRRELSSNPNALAPQVLDSVIELAHGLPERARTLLENKKARNNLIKINRDIASWLRGDFSQRLKICLNYAKDKKSTLYFIKELNYCSSFTQKGAILSAVRRLRNNVAPKAVLEELCMIE